MKKEDIQQILLFTVFFAIGTAAVSISLLGGELLRYHQGKELLKKNEIFLKRLEQINADYDALLKQLHEDPDTVKRLAPATLGIEPANDKKVAYPKAKLEQLAAARKALMENAAKEDKMPLEQNWITRCSKWPARIILFLAGSGLIIISLVYFGPSTGKTSLAENNSIGISED
jgi:hypothetical protein